jgi:hypothetical protein
MDFPRGNGKHAVSNRYAYPYPLNNNIVVLSNELRLLEQWAVHGVTPMSSTGLESGAPRQLGFQGPAP